MGSQTTQTGRRRAAGRILLVRVVGGGIAGAILGGLVAGLDHLTGLTLPVPVDHAQLLLGTLTGAIITVVVFALWMRTVVVGLVSGQISPRIVTGYLDDGFQRILIGGGGALVAFLAVTVLALPDLDDPTGPPAFGTVLGVTLTVMAIAGVLWSVQVAVRDLSLPNVIREVADNALDVLNQHVDADHDPPDRDGGDDVEALTTDKMGWITDIDQQALLEAVPEGTMVTLDADVGDFVALQQIVVRCDRELDDDARRAVLDAITVGRTRATAHDLAFAIQPLVDIAEHAMGSSSNDTSTAHEALVHLRAVLHEVLLRGTVTGWWGIDGDRWLRSTAVREPADHLQASLDRLRAAATTDPMIVDLARVVDQLRRTAEVVDDEQSLQVLDDVLSSLGGPRSERIRLRARHQPDGSDDASGDRPRGGSDGGSGDEVDVDADEAAEQERAQRDAEADAADDRQQA